MPPVPIQISGNYHSPPDTTISKQEMVIRFYRILSGSNLCCRRCGAMDDEPCLTWRGMPFEDGTRHKERKQKRIKR